MDNPAAVALPAGHVASTRRLNEHKLTDETGGVAMKVLAGLVAAGMLVCCNAAVAADIDLSTWTCQKFQSADKETIGIILTWLDGYYKDQDDPPVIDTDKFVDNAKELGQYCSAHPDQGLITAADKVFNEM